MSTDTDGAPPSVAPEPDSGSGSRETADQGPESGTAWLQDEIQRRIAAARNGSGGRHARHGGPDPAPAQPDYRARHATDRPEPVRRRPVPQQTSTLPESTQEAVGDDGAEVSTTWTRARALRPVRPRSEPSIDGEPRAEPGQDGAIQPEATGVDVADPAVGSRQSDVAEVAAPEPDAHATLADPPAAAERASPTDVPAGVPSRATIAPASDEPESTAGPDGVGRETAAAEASGRATTAPSRTGEAPAEAAAAEPATAIAAGEQSEGIADPVADPGPSGAEQTTPRPVPSTWSGLGRPPTDPVDGTGTVTPPSKARSRASDDGIGALGGPSLPDIRPRRRPRAVPLSSTWARPEGPEQPQASLSEVAPPSPPPDAAAPPSDEAPSPDVDTAGQGFADGAAGVGPLPDAPRPPNPTDSGPASDVRPAWQGPSSDVAAQPGLRPPWQPPPPDARLPRPAPPSGPAAARLLSDPPSAPPTVAIPTVPRLPATPPSAPPAPPIAQPDPDDLDDDLDDDYPDDADEDDGAEGVIWRASTPAPAPVPQAAIPEEPPPAPVYPPGKRVRVVLAERKASARPVRTVIDIQEDGAVGEVLRSELIASQMRVALGFALIGGLPIGLLPAMFDLFPDLGTIAIFGLRLPWLLLGLLVYPFLFGLGCWFTRVAERVEQDFADHVQD
jgi:hypothetical protein